MKPIKLFILVFFFSFNVFSQVKTEKVKFEDLPAKVNKNPMASVMLKLPNKEAVLDNLEKQISGKDLESDSFTFGKFFDFNFDFKNIEIFCDNGYCYREIEIESPGSNTLGFVFEKLELSPNAEFYIINDEELFFQGPLTKETVNINEGFISGLMPGDKLRLLLKEPDKEAGQSIIYIEQAVHGILDFFKVEKHISGRTQSVCFGCSAPCNNNIACVPDLNIESKAVALILIKNSVGDYIVRGTGALVNNGNQDKRPLFLTAAHIYNSAEWDNNSQFMFHFRSLQCSPSTFGSTTFFVQGSNNIQPIGQGLTDLKLIELKVNPGASPLFANNPVSYLGFSIIDEITPVQGIHHPLGDVQKHFAGTNVQVSDQTIGFGNYFYWMFDLSSGMHQPVSSGSPILNLSKRLISALSGKVSNSITPPFSCTGPNQGAIGGRLSKSWPAFCQFLDPNNEGIVALNTIISTPGSKIFPQVSGPNSICSTGLFTLTNSPLDIPIIWEVIQGSNLLSGPTSGSGKSATLTTLNQSVSGQVRIRFTVQNLCTSKQYTKNFWVGRPASPGGIQGGTLVYQGQILSYSIPVSQGATHYLWQLPSGWSGGGLLTSNIANLTVGSTSGNITVTPQNACGNSLTSSSLYVTVNSCQFCRSIEVWPNPANDYLSLLVSENSEGRIDLEKDLKGYVIYDIQGKMVANQEETRKINPNAIEVSGLIPGIYVIHLILETEIVTKRVIIER